MLYEVITIHLPFELPLLGEVRLPVYGMLFATGVLVAWWWFTRRARTLERNNFV